MPTVSAATVDFVSKKLRVEVANKRELEATVANITNVVQKLEPDVKVFVKKRVVMTTDIVTIMVKQM